MKTRILIVLLTLPLQVFAGTKIKLGLNWKPEPEFGGFYAAQVQGLYEKAGFDVEILEGASSMPISQMVATGKLDFGITSGDHLIISRSKGADIKAVYAIYQTSPQCIMVREDSGIKSIPDLMASDFTLSAGSGSPWLTFLQKKYAPKKLKIVPYQGGVSAYLNDPKLAQQCFVGSEPQLAEAKGVKTKTLLISDAGFDNHAAVLITSNSLIKKDRALVQKFVETTRLGWQAYLKDPLAAHTKIAQLNPVMAGKAAEIIFKDQKPLMMGSAPLGSLSQARWETLTNQMLELGLIKKAVPADSLIEKF